MALYRMTALGTAAGQQVRNVFHVDSAVAEATPDELAGSFRTAFQTAFLPSISNGYTFTGVEAREIAGAERLGYAPATVTIGGDSTGGSSATFLVASVRWNTPVRGRSGQGRTGIGPLATTKVVGNNLEAAFRTDLVTRATQFIADLASSGGNAAMGLQVVSFISNNVERAVPQAAPVTSASVNTLIGTRLTRHLRTG